MVQENDGGSLEFPKGMQGVSKSNFPVFKGMYKVKWNCQRRWEGMFQIKTPSMEEVC